MRLSPFWQFRRTVFRILGKLGRPDPSGVDAVDLVDDDSFAEDRLDGSYEHDTPEKQERELNEIAFLQRLWKCAERDDPDYRPNLSLIGEDNPIRVWSRYAAGDEAQGSM